MARAPQLSPLPPAPSAPVLAKTGPTAAPAPTQELPTAAAPCFSPSPSCLLLPPSAMSEAYLAHRIIRRIASWAVVSFFTEIHVIGSENVPRDGPIIA